MHGVARFVPPSGLASSRPRLPNHRRHHSATPRSSTMFARTTQPLASPTSRTRKNTRRSTKIDALFKKKAPPPPPPPPPKKSFFSFGAKKSEPPPPPPPPTRATMGFGFGRKARSESTAAPVRDVEYVREESKSEAYARIRKARERSRKEFEAKERGGVSYALFSVARALDFQEDIESDRGLLNAARRMRNGDKMSTEQYGALRRKVGGTKGGFFGENVDVVGAYTDKGYVDKDDVGTDIVGAPFLAAVLLGVLGTTIWVAVQVP